MNESSAKAIDRRPIATRNRKWAQSATAWLASRNVSPNAISIAGMCACIAAGLALALTSVEYNRIFWLVAALGAQLRLTANMLDGMVALASGRDSKVGELYNEVPDRVSDAAVFIGARITPGAETLRLVTSQRFWQSSRFTFALQEKSRARLTSFADRWRSNTACWSLPLPAVYSAVVPRSWQIFHFANLDVGVMALALSLIIAGCLVTVVRRLQRIARALR